MPVNIKGKEYVTVAERMEGMRQSGKPFEIVESMPIQIGERCVWRVAILLDGCKFYGSAEAHFNAKPGSADATDPFACAETSAVGRALGFAGFGSFDSIASADEIVRTEQTTQQERKPAQITTRLEAPNPWDLQKLFKSINQTIHTAQKLTFPGQPIKNTDDLTQEERLALKKTYDGWKATYDARQKAS